MKYARAHLIEYISEQEANSSLADYAEKAPSEFPEAEILLTIRTGPYTAISVSVYPDEETAVKTMVARNERAVKMTNVTKNVELHQGEVSLSVVR